MCLQWKRKSEYVPRKSVFSRAVCSLESDIPPIVRPLKLYILLNGASRAPIPVSRSLVTGFVASLFVLLLFYFVVL